MAVALVGSVGTKNDGGTAATRTLSYALDAAADLIFVRVHWREVVVLNSVTWNGVALTACGAEQVDADGQRVKMFYLVAPAIGTFNVVATFAANVSFTILGVTGHSGVHQSTPVSSFQTGTGTSAASPATITDVTSAIGDMVMAAISADNAVDVAVQNQTADYEAIDAFVSLMGAGGHAAGAATVNPEWTYASNNSWAMQAVNLVAAAGGGSSLLLKLMQMS